MPVWLSELANFFDILVARRPQAAVLERVLIAGAVVAAGKRRS